MCSFIRAHVSDHEQLTSVKLQVLGICPLETHDFARLCLSLF